MVIQQGDIYWIDLGRPAGSGPSYKHPHVVVQNNVFNQSRIRTVVVCAITSNLERAKAPGNILLKKGEGNLSKDGVINVSQILTVDKSDLYERIGSLSTSKIRQVVEGIQLLIQPRDAD
jgi:mRNA interferase MazF